VEDGYFPSSSGLASVEPGIAYDHRVAVDALGAQQHSLGTNVSPLDALLYRGRLMSIIPKPLVAADIRAWPVARHHLQQSCPVHRRSTPLRVRKFSLLKF